MKEHHAKALEKAKARLLENSPDILAIILGGSIAKGIEREDSDVDLIVVLPDADYLKRCMENRVGFLWTDVCDYKGGYVEGRFVSRSFITEAAQRGSEPTRHSFTGTYPIYCVDEEVERCLPAIPMYPSEHQSENITAFLAQMQLNRWFFWGEGKRRGDLYLQTRAATDIVLFGCRLILAHNNILFACQKRLVEQTLAAPNKPENMQKMINRIFTEMSDDSREDFCKSIEQLVTPKDADLLSRFLQDVEMSWYHQTHAVSEW
jgi:hypothetical protein